MTVRAMRAGSREYSSIRSGRTYQRGIVGFEHGWQRELQEPNAHVLPTPAWRRSTYYSIDEHIIAYPIV